MTHMVTQKERDLLDAFRESGMTPTGEWWYGFPLGFGLEYGNLREADAICITSRSSNSSDNSSTREATVESPSWFREQRQADWLEGEQVTIVEAKSAGGTWRALGQLIVYREMFEMDWKASVDALIIVAEESVPGRDSEWLFNTRLDEAELFIFDGEEFR